MRRNVLTAAAPACLLIGLTPVAALADDAPVATATATAARVSDDVAISQSTTKADKTQSEAQATVISVGGQPVLGTHGAAAGEGEDRGALIDTVDKSPVRIQVAPWHVRADGTKDSEKRTSSASAALATVEVPDVAKVGVLTSDATSEHTAKQSTGKSTSNALEVTAGNSLHLVVLHSEVDSAAKGNSYLVSLNGTKIGTQEQLSTLCALELPGLASLSCLTSSGGTANGVTSGSAEVLGVQTSLPLNPASAFATTGTAGSGTPAILESVAQAVPAPAIEAPRAAAVTPTATLPRTGTDASGLAASGLSALLAGLAMRLFGRRRSSTA